MIRTDEVRDRIEERVPVLAGRFGFAAEFTTLIQQDALPQVTPAGFVLPGLLVGGAATALTGAFLQDFRETVIVVLVVRVAGDLHGAGGVDELTPIIRDTIAAVCGWGPEESPGVFELGSGELVGSKDDCVIYQLDFVLDDQMRIT